MNNCPRCGGKLEDGFVQSAKPIAFVKKFRWVKIWERDGDFQLPWFVTGAYLPAEYCEQCDSITIFSERKGE
jgi:hypothetical protein